MVITEIIKNTSITIDPKHTVMYDTKSQREIKDMEKIENTIDKSKEKIEKKLKKNNLQMPFY